MTIENTVDDETDSRDVSVTGRAGGNVKWLLGFLVVVFAIFNLVFQPLALRYFDESLSNETATFSLRLFLNAVWVAQHLLLALWWVYAPVSVWRRLAIGAAVGFLWYGTYVAGKYHVLIPLYLEAYELGAYRTATLVKETFQIAANWPIKIVALLSALWGTWAWLGWRIEPTSSTTFTSQRRQLQIRDQAIAFVTVAVALILARFGNDYYLGTLKYAGATALFAGASGIPLMWAFLRQPKSRWPLSAAVASHMVIAASLAQWYSSLSAHTEFLGLYWLMIWCGAFGLVAVHFAIVMFTLIGVRRCGFCLRWGQE